MLGFFKRMFGRVNKKYVSNTDLFLYKTRRGMPLSQSQKQEMQKHRAIAEARDHVQTKESNPVMWEKF